MVDVGPTHAMHGGLFVDRAHLPVLVGRFAARQPLDRAAVVRVGRLPAGSQGEIQLPVAVDIQRSDADVIEFGLVFDDRVPLPGWVLVPENAIRIDDDNVGSLIGVDVHQRNGVADLQPCFDFLRLEVQLLLCRQCVRREIAIRPNDKKGERRQITSQLLDK